MAAAMLAPMSTLAQQIPPNSGSTLRQLEPPTLILPQKPPAGVEVEPAARPALKPTPELRIVRFTLKAFLITGATAFPEAELQQALQEFIGRDVGFQELGAAAARLTRFYSERGYPLATAYLPAQEIKDGVVELVILEGRYGRVQLQNRSRVSDSVISSYLENLPGRIVEDASLERKILLIYDLPGIAPAKAVLIPGQAVGETDFRIELDSARAVSGGIELDNYGNRYTGGNRYSGFVDFFSPGGLGDRLSARAIRGDPGLEYVYLTYQLPLGGDGLQAGAAYSLAKYRLGKQFASLQASGDAQTLLAFASYPLVRSRGFSLYARAGYESKQFEDRIGASPPPNVSNRKSHIATLSLSGDHYDPAGAASAFSLTYGSGRLNIETPDTRDRDDVTAHTNGAFQKWNLNFARLQNLSGGLSAFVSFMGQKASKNLHSSEQLVLGGPQGVRAYPPGEGLGDSGYLLTGELRYAFNVKPLPGIMNLVGFIDTGEVKINEQPFAPVANRRRLSGGGVGLNWEKSNDFSMRLNVAHRIGNETATAGADRLVWAWLQLIKYF
jgi:hemolysin activation/secretion protein